MEEKSELEKSFWRKYRNFKARFKKAVDRILGGFIGLFVNLGKENLSFSSNAEKDKYLSKRKFKTLFFLIASPLILSTLIYLDTSDALMSIKVIPIFYMLVAFALFKYKVLAKTFFIPVIRIITIPAMVVYYIAGAYGFGRFLIKVLMRLIFGKAIGMKAAMFWGFITFFLFERLLLNSIIAEYKISSFKKEEWNRKVE